MSVWQVLLLAAIHGILEFLPVSSTGVVLLSGHLMHMDADGIVYLLRFLRLGSLLALIAFFRRDIIRLCLEFFRMLRDIMDNLHIRRAARRAQEEPRYRKVVSNNYRKILLLLLVACLPGAVIGFGLGRFTGGIYKNMLASAIGFGVTAMLFFVVCFNKAEKVRLPKDSRYYEGFVIGCFSGASFIPGLTRVGSALSACYLFEFGKKYAVRFTFLSGIPVLFGMILFATPLCGNAGANDVTVLSCVLAVMVPAVIGYLLLRAATRLLAVERLRLFAVVNLVLAAACLVVYL